MRQAPAHARETQSAALQLCRTTIACIEIGWSARKHGIDDEDIEHVMEHAMTIENQDDGALLDLGPSRRAALLEVVKVVRDDGSELVIHAMPITFKHERLLPGCRVWP